MQRPNYIADPDRPCYCGTPCEETGRRWNPSVLCAVCKEHAKHEHCDAEGHCLDAAGLCVCHVCHVCQVCQVCQECGEFVDEGARFCSACDKEGCGDECMCETRTAHEESREESERDFLRDPGQPPAHWTENQKERARLGMEERRRKLSTEKHPGTSTTTAADNIEALRKLIASDSAGHVLDALAMARRLHARGVRTK